MEKIEFENAKALKPLFDIGCQSVRLEREPVWGCEAGTFQYQVFTDRNVCYCQPGKTVKEAVANAIKRIKEGKK